MKVDSATVPGGAGGAARPCLLMIMPALPTHSVSESACWECDLGWKTAESCKQHICPDCCMKVVTAREQAYDRIRAYKTQHDIKAPFTLGMHAHKEHGGG